MGASAAGACHRHLRQGRDPECDERNAAWGGQWDAAQIFISMGVHATTDNLERDDEFTVAFATAGTMAAADYVIVKK